MPFDPRVLQHAPWSVSKSDALSRCTHLYQLKYILKAKDGYVARKPRRSKKFGGWYLCDECGEPHDNPPGPCPRRSKSVSNSPAPTTEIPPAVSESQASLQGQGEARNADGTPYIAAAESGMTGAAQPECETVPTSDDVVTGSPAVCRWEVGRWGI